MPRGMYPRTEHDKREDRKNLAKARMERWKKEHRNHPYHETKSACERHGHTWVKGKRGVHVGYCRF